MARTIKVSKEKVMKERALEAGDKNKEDMQKLGMENRDEQSKSGREKINN